MTNQSPIGYVVKMFPRLSETFIRNEILQLERHGLVLRIFSLKRPTDAEAYLSDARVRASVVYLPERIFREPFRVLKANLGTFRGHPRGYVRTLWHVLRGRELRSLARGLRRFCQTCCLVHEMGGVQHLHAHFANDPTRLASWARMICNVSYSVTTHAKDLYQEDRVSSPGLRYKLNHATFVVTNSKFSANALLRSFNSDPMPKIFTIYNSIDLSEFRRRQQDSTEPMILSVGRLVEKKGFENLVTACRLLADSGTKFTCEIVGSGPLKDVLAEKIHELHLEQMVRLRGQMPRLAVRDLYMRAQIFALPCIVAANGDRDILPNVLKEAMAVGVPIVTTLLGGIEELITHEENGLLVRSGDAKALAHGLRRLLSDTELRQRLANAARTVIEKRFDLRVNFAPLKELLLAALPQPPREGELQLCVKQPTSASPNISCPPEITRSITGRAHHSVCVENRVGAHWD